MKYKRFVGTGYICAELSKVNEEYAQYWLYDDMEVAVTEDAFILVDAGGNKFDSCNDIIYDFNFRTTTSFSVIADDMGNYYISAFEDKNFEHWKEVTQC